MDTSPAFVSTQLLRNVSIDGSRASGEPERLVRVNATYALSEDGRKASLLAGGDGRAVQQVTIEVTASRLHLVTVDDEGIARLKLRPRYSVDAEQRIVRTDRAPVFDVLPTCDDLLKDAARNHQLERAYHGEQLAAREKRRETLRDRRERVAQEFLNDRARRAERHPVPNPERCEIMSPQGRVYFDAVKHDGASRLVPAEAHRRFRSDQRARSETKRQKHAEQTAIHEEKKRFVAEWVATKGTPDHQARYAGGVLPIDEAIEAMADEAFQPLNGFPLYARDGAERLQVHLRRSQRFAEARITPADLEISVQDSEFATEAQWALIQQIKELVPNATVVLRAHRLAWKRAPNGPSLTVFGLRVKLSAGPFVVVREYDVPD